MTLLRFDEPLETWFQEESDRASLAVVRWGLLLGIVLYAVFGILDGYMLPETHGFARLVRFAVVIPILVAVVVLSSSPRFVRVQAATVAATALVLAGGILAMMWASRPEEPGFRHYSTGLMLVLIWLGTFAQLRFRPVVWTVAAILAGYVGVAVVRQGMTAGGMENPNTPVFISNSFFLASAAILAVFSAWAFEASKRAGFLQTRQIQSLLGRIETLFGQQVSAEVAQTLVRETDNEASRVLDVTVMFMDIREFTRLADAREPRAVATLQNTVFDALIRIVVRHGGIINQLLGDGLMATFGAPVAREGHAADAVRAGLEMLAAVATLVDEGTIPPIRVGIGLHSGEVVAGNIGNELRKQYSLAGSTVIVAARMERLNKTYDSRMLISDAVVRRLGDTDPTGEDLGEVSLKGLERPVRIHRLA
ncbi:MAG TPA: adenylate/guanylate cyclase domain-containing protein [Longimicrobiales bacterium]|nr:adenylate/guanylate cyclase domain-containing protein [Longimicrobiales bacterium]